MAMHRIDNEYNGAAREAASAMIAAEETERGGGDGGLVTRTRTTRNSLARRAPEYVRWLPLLEDESWGLLQLSG